VFTNSFDCYFYSSHIRSIRVHLDRGSITLHFHTNSTPIPFTVLEICTSLHQSAQLSISEFHVSLLISLVQFTAVTLDIFGVCRGTCDLSERTTTESIAISVLALFTVLATTSFRSFAILTVSGHMVYCTSETRSIQSRITW
jgi:hypothetical protein